MEVTDETYTEAKILEMAESEDAYLIKCYCSQGSPVDIYTDAVPGLYDLCSDYFWSKIYKLAASYSTAIVTTVVNYILISLLNNLPKLIKSKYIML